MSATTPATDTTSTANLSGTVTDAITHETISGVSVTVTSNKKSTTAKTGSSGAYSFQGLAVGAYSLTAEGGFYEPYTADNIQLNAGDNVKNFLMQFEDAGMGGYMTGSTATGTGSVANLSGIVTDDNTGDPIGGATITLTDANNHDTTATTNSSGAYSIEGLAVGAYAIVVSGAAQYQEIEEQAEFGGGNSVRNYQLVDFSIDVTLT